MKLRLTALAIAASCALTGQVFADEAAAKKWIDSEFQPSTLSKDKQAAEMKWFIDAAKKLQECILYRVIRLHRKGTRGQDLLSEIEQPWKVASKNLRRRP